RERREQSAQSRTHHCHGHALSAAARLHRAGPRARAVRRPHPQERRQIAGARAREARLRLGEAGGDRRMSAVAPKISALERYRAAFEARWPQSDPLTRLRRAALEEFIEQGFPTQRQEAWKYTNLRRLESRSFEPSTAPAAIDAAQEGWIAHGGARIVFVDGRWSAALSSSSVQPPGVTMLPLGQWFRRDPEQAAAFVESLAPKRSTAFERLNMAFFEDGAVIQLAEGARTDEPIYIVHHWSAQAAGRMAHPRLLLRAARGSRCTLIEQHLGPADLEYFTNAATIVELEAGAELRHYRLQQESTRSFHIGLSSARLQADSRYFLHDVALGASLARHDVAAVLEGRGAHVELQGLFAPEGSQHMDVHTHIDHAAPCTTSAEDYRGVA